MSKEKSRNGFIRGFAARRGRACFEICSFLLLLLSVGAFSDVSGLFFDQISHFRFQYFLAAAVGVLISLLFGRFRIALLWLLSLALNLWVLLPYFSSFSLASQPKLEEGEVLEAPLLVAVANIYYHNTSRQKAVSKLLALEMDVLVLVENSIEWRGALKKLDAAYPYSLSRGTTSLFSKYSMKEIELSENPVSFRPLVFAQVDAPFGQFKIIAAHPPHPVSASNLRLQAKQFEYIAKIAKGETGPVLLAGDLNTTPWSSAFETLLTSSGLEDSRLGFGLNPTWPNRLDWFGIPIDHLLYSSHWRVREFYTERIAGSDHQALIVELGLGEGFGEDEIRQDFHK